MLNSSVTQNVTVSSSTDKILPGPIEILVDVPILLGCFRVLDISQLPAQANSTSNLTPGGCITQCLQSAQRFAGWNVYIFSKEGSKVGSLEILNKDRA